MLIARLINNLMAIKHNSLKEIQIGSYKVHPDATSNENHVLGFSQYPHHEYNLHHHCKQASAGERDTQKWFCSVWWFGLRTAVPVCIVWAKNWLQAFVKLSAEALLSNCLTPLTDDTGANLS